MYEMFGGDDEEDLFAALPSALREALEFGSAPVERDRESLDKSSTGWTAPIRRRA